MSRPFPNSKIWNAIDWLGDATAIHPRNITPILSVALFHANPLDTPKPGEIISSTVRPRPGLRAHIVWLNRQITGPDYNLWYMPFFHRHGDSLYYNAPVFIRIMWPFVGIMVRWSGSETSRSFLQCHVGWKLNGRFAVVLRVQSDVSAAGGMDFANPDQGFGWSYRGK